MPMKTKFKFPKIHKFKQLEKDHKGRIRSRKYTLKAAKETEAKLYARKSPNPVTDPYSKQR